MVAGARPVRVVEDRVLVDAMPSPESSTLSESEPLPVTVSAPAMAATTPLVIVGARLPTLMVLAPPLLVFRAVVAWVALTLRVSEPAPVLTVVGPASSWRLTVSVPLLVTIVVVVAAAVLETVRVSDPLPRVRLSMAAPL